MLSPPTLLVASLVRVVLVLVLLQVGAIPLEAGLLALVPVEALVVALIALVRSRRPQAARDPRAIHLGRRQRLRVVRPPAAAGSAARRLQ